MARFYNILFLCIAWLTVASCTNDGDIGDLYGKWQIDRIETPDTTALPCDLYLSFQSNVSVAQVLSANGHYCLELHAVYRHEGDSLIFCFLPMDGIGQTMHAMISQRFLMGDDYRNVRLGIDKLNGSQLILTDDHSTRWLLRHY